MDRRSPIDHIRTKTLYELAYDGGEQTITVPLNRAANVKISISWPDNSGIHCVQYGVYDISFS